jgi:rare lipoprotein A
MQRVALALALVAALSCADVRAPRAPAGYEPAGPRRAIEPSRPGSPEPRPSARSEQGKASYYSDKLAGRKTANGERYDPRALTAAHRTLPFGTVVVVSRADGRSVRVRINDRGPFAESRIIDLSRSAAEQLGMIRAGVVDVTVTVDNPPGAGP